MNLWTLLSLAIVVFASSNIDDIFILISFMADRHFRFRNIALGQYAGMGALVVVSLTASLISMAIRQVYVGFLGFAPIVIGVLRLIAVLRNRDEDEIQPHRSRAGSAGQILAVAAVTIANGGDNIGVYAPLLATQSAPERIATVVIFAVLTAIWIAFAHGLVTHPRLGAPIRRYGHIVVPFVLIGVGIYILYDAGTLDLLRSLLAPH